MILSHFISFTFRLTYLITRRPMARTNESENLSEVGSAL